MNAVEVNEREIFSHIIMTVRIRRSMFLRLRLWLALRVFSWISPWVVRIETACSDAQRAEFEEVAVSNKCPGCECDLVYLSESHLVCPRCVLKRAKAAEAQVEQLREDLRLLSEQRVYRGNSVAYIYDKKAAYAKNIDEVNAALRATGESFDGEVSNVELIRRLGVRASLAESALAKARGALRGLNECGDVVALALGVKRALDALALSAPAEQPEPPKGGAL